MLPIGKKIALVQCPSSAFRTAGVSRPGAVVECQHDFALPQKIVGLEVLKAEARAAGRVDLDHAARRRVHSADWRNLPARPQRRRQPCPTVPVVSGMALCACAGPIRPAPNNSVVATTAVIRITNLYRPSCVERSGRGRSR